MSERLGWERVNDLRTLVFGLPLGTKLTADIRLDIAGHLNELVDYTNRLEASHVKLQARLAENTPDLETVPVA